MPFAMMFNTDGGRHTGIGYRHTLVGAAAAILHRPRRGPFWRTQTLMPGFHRPTSQRAEFTAVILALEWFEWIPREQNTIADDACSRALEDGLQQELQNQYGKD
ncbi:hypothetical protein F4810DRAFT_716887 [Camillea tinctor]|nr:hypothetical protein F4810DRAFT_716887 [Camillea tinctor]